MLIHFISMHNIVCDTEKPATKPQKWSIKKPHGKLAQRCASVFPARKSRGLGASTDFHLLTVRHVILRHVLVASRNSRERERDSIVLSRCRRCTRILQFTSNVHTSLDQQCSPFISCSRIAEKTRLTTKKNTGTRDNSIQS